MKLGVQNIALERYKRQKVYNQTRYSIYQKNIQGTIVFVEDDTQYLRMRISYKFYEPRYPRIIEITQFDP